MNAIAIIREADFVPRFTAATIPNGRPTTRENKNEEMNNVSVFPIRSR